MRRLILLRHSKTERAEPGESDRARVLTDRGRDDAGQIGAYMMRHDVVPDLVLVSTAARAQETWKYVVSALKPKPTVQSVDRLYAAPPSAMLDVIKQAPAAANTVLVVGHNPGMHEFALLLIASGDVEEREQLREKLPTSGLAVIDFAVKNWVGVHPHSGRLERYITPKLLKAATK